MKKEELKLTLEKNSIQIKHYDIHINNRYDGYVILLFERDNYWLNEIEIFSAENKSTKYKYGSTIINYLIREYPTLKISLSSKKSHENSGIHEDKRYLKNKAGFNLSKSCFINGILFKSNFEFPYDICNLYKEDSFLDNYVYKFMNQFNYKLNKIKSISFKEIKNINKFKN